MKLYNFKLVTSIKNVFKFKFDFFNVKESINLKFQSLEIKYGLVTRYEIKTPPPPFLFRKNTYLK